MYSEKSSWYLKKILLRIFNFKAVIGMTLGATAGFLYYYFVGCTSNSCPITSNPWKSLAWGLIIGWLAGDAFYSGKNNKSKNPSS